MILLVQLPCTGIGSPIGLDLEHTVSHPLPNFLFVASSLSPISTSLFLSIAFPADAVTTFFFHFLAVIKKECLNVLFFHCCEQVKMKALELEPQAECLYDYLEVVDPEGVSGGEPIRLCGHYDQKKLEK